MRGNVRLKRNQLDLRRGDDGRDVFLHNPSAELIRQKRSVKKMHQLYRGRRAAMGTGDMQHVRVNYSAGTGGENGSAPRRVVFQRAAFHIEQLHRLVPVPENVIAVQKGIGTDIRKLAGKAGEPFLAAVFMQLHFQYVLHFAPCFLSIKCLQIIHQRRGKGKPVSRRECVFSQFCKNVH